ncbi:hypothetical protein QTN25_006012 [Entamoeba marina]
MNDKHDLQDILDGIVENDNKKKLLRKMFLEKEHEANVQMINEQERALKKVAVQGVLQLFNAISLHQHKLKLAKLKDQDNNVEEDELIDETVSKDDFFGKILSTQQKEMKELKDKKMKTSKSLTKATKEKQARQKKHKSKHNAIENESKHTKKHNKSKHEKKPKKSSR